jgi:DNA-binding CsgD family transcriptional regulator
MRHLDRRDYEGLLGFIADASAVEEPLPFTPPLLDRLASLIRCEAATFFEYAPGASVSSPGGTVISAYVPCSNENPDEWRDLNESCARSDELQRRKAMSADPVILADVFPRRLRVARDFNPNYADFGVVDEMHLNLDREQHWSAELGIFRGRDMGERERLLLRLLQPHLVALYRTARLRRLVGSADGAASVLTRREREVVFHVAQGLTNAEIARELVIESSTVRKHLEHVFDKLGVSSRSAAVAKLRPQLPRAN